VHSLLCPALIAVGFLAAADPPKPPPKPTMPSGTPAEQVSALIKDFFNRWEELSKASKAAKTEAEREKLTVMFPDSAQYAALLLKIAEDHPKDPAVIDGLEWITRYANGPENREAKTKARAILVRDHLMSPKIGSFCASLKNEFFDPTVVPLLRQVIEKHPDKAVQAQTMYALAALLQSRAAESRWLAKVDKEMLDRFIKAYGAEGIEDLKRSDPIKEKKEAEALFDRLVQDKDFAAASFSRGTKQAKVGDLAASELFEIRHLQPGMPAPEITGTDIDGHAMKLSDFRGKVVLLDFWGHW
jgi:hypothetical protein